MTVSYTVTTVGDTTTVTVASTLTPPVYYFWYLDGQYLGMTEEATRAFNLLAGEQARIDVLDSTDEDFDPYANAPAAYPSRKTIFWIRSPATDVDYYRVEQQADGGEWETVETIPADPDAWSYSSLTERLDDLTTYAWRIIPVDVVGNDGTPLAFAAELIVRIPDAPAFAVTIDPDTSKITFAEAV